MNTFSRRTLLGLGAATAAAITLPGCSGKSGPMRVEIMSLASCSPMRTPAS